MASFRSNQIIGPRTRREFYRFVTSPDYTP
jgi:hypothetical protein